jgi:putative membrane protein
MVGVVLKLGRGAGMSRSLLSFLKRWMILTIAVVLAANIVPGIHFYTVSALVLATLLLGLLNAFVRPVMLVLSLPLLIFTLGLFILVINAFLLYFVGHVLKGFEVETFGSAFWGSVVISIVSLLLNAVTKSGGRVQFRRQKGPPRSPPGEGGGPVIDV